MNRRTKVGYAAVTAAFLGFFGWILWLTFPALLASAQRALGLE